MMKPSCMISTDKLVRDGLSSVGWDYLWSSCDKFKISTLTITKRWKVNAEIGVVRGLRVTQGHWQHSRSIEHTW